MPRYRVWISGRALWISLDDQTSKVAFRVSRIVDAADAREAGAWAVAHVADDPKAQPVPGWPPPVIEVDRVEPTSDGLERQPGFAFFADVD